MLKLTVPDLGEVEELHRNLYRARADGGGYILDVEGGVVAKSVHDEFRTNNIALQKRVREIGEIDPEQVALMRTENEQLRGDLEKARKGAAADAEARVKAMEAKANGYRQQLSGLLIDSEVTRAATALGALPAALDDVATRVRGRFRLSEDGKPVAVDSAGNTIYGEDGRALSVDGAVRQLTTQAPHLFRPSSGSGAANTSAGGGRSTVTNPFKKESFNLTEQSRIIKTNLPEAERLAAEAGVTI